MPSAADILRRFRFHAVPGAPAPAGVPVDKTTQLEAELAPVFSMLEGVQLRAEEIVDEALADAARRRSETDERGRRIVAQARKEAVSARSGSAATLLSHMERQRTALLAEARREARRVESNAAERTPSLVEMLVQRVLSLGAE